MTADPTRRATLQTTGSGARTRVAVGRDRAPALVALPSVGFWVAKGLSTAMGESVSDWAVNALVPQVAVVASFLGFGVALAVQLRRRTYSRWTYWATVAMVGVFGTMAADVTHVVLGVPYVLSAAAYGIALAALFAAWHRWGRSIDVHAVTSSRQQLLYWAAVVLTFALGTAVGDWTAIALHLGYAGSAALFAAAIAVPALAYQYWHWNPVACFWTAYVLTRPLGASLADLFGKPTDAGGLGVGSGLVGLALLVAMSVTVLAARRRIDPHPTEPAAR